MEHPTPQAGPRRALPRLAGMRRLAARRPKAAALLLAGLVAVSGGAAGVTWLAAHPARAPAAPRLARPSPGLPAVMPGLAAARPPARGRRVGPPASLIIPAIGVRTPLTRLGLTLQGTLEVPASASVA